MNGKAAIPIETICLKYLLPKMADEDDRNIVS